MSPLRSAPFLAALVPTALLGLMLFAGPALAGSTTMSVGLVLRAPGEAGPAPQRDGVINAAGDMHIDGARPEALAQAIARAPRLERTGDLQPDGSRLHSIQF